MSKTSARHQRASRRHPSAVAILKADRNPFAARSTLSYLRQLARFESGMGSRSLVKLHSFTSRTILAPSVAIEPSISQDRQVVV